jgi:hypothetical protein
MPNETPPLLALANAAIYIDELARGVQGEFIIEMDSMCDPEDAERTVAEIHECQLVLVREGWLRHPQVEEVYQRGFTHNVEVAVYGKRFSGERNYRFVQINLTTRFGVRAVFIGKR